MKKKMVVIDVETTGLNPRKDKLHGLGIQVDGVVTYHRAFSDRLPPNIVEILADPEVPKLGHNIIFDAKFLHFKGYEVRGKLWDTRILAHLIDENNSCSLKPLTERYFGAEFLNDKSELDKAIVLTKSGHVGNLAAKDIEDPNHPYAELIGRYCIEDVRNTYKLYELLKDKLKTLSENQKKIFRGKLSVFDYFVQESIPFLQAQFEMEKQGIRIDMNAVANTKLEISQKMAALDAEMRTIAAEFIPQIEDTFREAELIKRLNKLKSEDGKKRLREEAKARIKTNFEWTKHQYVIMLLMAYMKIPRKMFGTTAKGGVGLDVSTMNSLLANLPRESQSLKLIKALAAYKKLLKTSTTYLGEVGKRGLLSCIENERVYPEYNAIIKTGRLSCSNPNVQQIPRGSSIKKFFVGDDDQHVIVHSDASQLELRIAAHISRDPQLLEAYREGRDLHKQTATALFEKEKITDEQRQVGKTTNFLLIFDGGPQRLQTQLQSQAKMYFEIDECKEFKYRFFEKYGVYKQYLESQLKSMTRRGVVVSESGRIRRLPDIKYGQYINYRNQEFTGPKNLRQELAEYLKSKGVQRIDDRAIFEAASKKFSHAKKQGYNFPIQSLGATITKRAIIELQKKGFRVICTVHDSIDVQLPKSQLDKIPEIQYTLENAYKMEVPLKWDLKLLNSFDEKDLFITEDKKNEKK